MGLPKTVRHVTAPVTTQLLNALIETEQLLKKLNAPDARVNDKDHFGAVVSMLEQLAKEVMKAQCSDSLLRPTTGGARFSVNPHGPVVVALNEAVGYLGNEASNLLRSNGLSMYQNEHLTTSIGELTKLYSAVTHGARIQAEKDMDRIQRERGADWLVAIAVALSLTASGNGTLRAWLADALDADPS